MGDMDPIVVYVGLRPVFIADLADWMNTRKDRGEFRIHDLANHPIYKYEIVFKYGSIKGGSIKVRSARSGIGSMLEVYCPYELHDIWDGFLAFMRNAEKRKEEVKKQSKIPKDIFYTYTPIPPLGNSKVGKEQQSETPDIQRTIELSESLTATDLLILQHDFFEAKEIAERLKYQPSTVNDYSSKVKLKTGLEKLERKELYLKGRTLYLVYKDDRWICRYDPETKMIKIEERVKGKVIKPRQQTPDDIP